MSIDEQSIVTRQLYAAFTLVVDATTTSLADAWPYIDYV
jgi:hypothetical protein